jgi:hypothetical protein
LEGLEEIMTKEPLEERLKKKMKELEGSDSESMKKEIVDLRSRLEQEQGKSNYLEGQLEIVKESNKKPSLYRRMVSGLSDMKTDIADLVFGGSSKVATIGVVALGAAGVVGMVGYGVYSFISNNPDYHMMPLFGAGGAMALDMAALVFTKPQTEPDKYLSVGEILGMCTAGLVSGAGTGAGLTYFFDSMSKGPLPAGSQLAAVAGGVIIGALGGLLAYGLGEEAIKRLK